MIMFRDVSSDRSSGKIVDLLARVVDHTADSVFITEPDGRIVYVNPAFERTTGYSADEALGSTPRLLRSGHHEREFYRRLWDTVLAGQVFRGTVINRKKNGELFHSEQTISAIADAGGRCEYLVSVAKDMTERLRSERHRAQLEDAYAIQQRLYPKDAPRIAGFDVAGAVHPAEDLCGDIYDFFLMPDGSSCITVADVCGHGVGPAILMAQTRAYLRSLARSNNDIGEILSQLNEILTVEGSEREFVTQILMRLDPDARTLEYSNAGHPEGFLLDRVGEIRERLGPCGNIPLGIFGDRLYPTSRAIRLELGDIAVLYTDGIAECSGPDGSEYGTGRILELVRRHRRDSAGEILEALFRSASSFSAGPQMDDMTAIVCKFEGMG